MSKIQTHQSRVEATTTSSGEGDLYTQADVADWANAEGVTFVVSSYHGAVLASGSLTCEQAALLEMALAAHRAR